MCLFLFFFFQAEDGIRDRDVTGVQTCALPIYTCLEKYGVEHISQSQIFKDKFKITSLEKYGVEHPFKSKEIRDKIKEN